MKGALEITLIPGLTVRKEEASKRGLPGGRGIEDGHQSSSHSGLAELEGSWQ